MPKINKPLLSATFDASKARFPYIATPKIDGIRFLMIDGVAVSRTFKPIRNRHIQALLGAHLPDGIDGELTAGSTFQDCSSGIMSIDGEPEFKVWIFDYVRPERAEILPYQQRLVELPAIKATFDFEVLTGQFIKDAAALDAYEERCLQQGFEGVMVRDPNGTYKFGRATVKESIIAKVKRFEDSEAVLVAIEEKLSNQNAAEQDAFGHTKRSTCAAGMVPTGVAGTLVVRDTEGREFGVGSGLNDKLRQEIWANQEQYIGKLVKYKYFPQGVKELPRHPVFLGFRDPDDL